MLRELAVQDLLDALIPPHERNEVTVGECVEALVLTISFSPASIRCLV
jgi:hypothetical protein